jgi:hypothetical protein
VDGVAERARTLIALQEQSAATQVRHAHKIARAHNQLKENYISDAFVRSSIACCHARSDVLFPRARIRLADACGQRARRSRSTFFAWQIAHGCAMLRALALIRRADVHYPTLAAQYDRSRAARHHAEGFASATNKSLAIDTDYFVLNNGRHQDSRTARPRSAASAAHHLKEAHYGKTSEEKVQA